MPKLKTLSRFLAPVALLALAACQTPPPGGDVAAPSTSPSVGQTDRTEPSAQAPEMQMAEPLLVFLADVTPQEDWILLESDGNPNLYLHPDTLLMRDDLLGVGADVSPEGEGLLVLELKQDASARLAATTKNNPGRRLALVVADMLLAVPAYSQPYVEGPLTFRVGSVENATIAAEIITGEDTSQR